MKKYLVIFLNLVAISSAKITKCGDSNVPMPKSVKIDGCEPTEERCTFYRGHNLVAIVEFTALTEIKWLFPQINVTVDGVRAETTLPSYIYEGCDWLVKGTQQCPIPKGKDAKWRLEIPIVLTDPLVPMSMEVSLIGSEDDQQFCFSTRGKIVEKLAEKLDEKMIQ